MISSQRTKVRHEFTFPIILSDATNAMVTVKVVTPKDIAVTEAEIKAVVTEYVLQPGDTLVAAVKPLIDELMGNDRSTVFVQNNSKNVL